MRHGTWAPVAGKVHALQLRSLCALVRYFGLPVLSHAKQCGTQSAGPGGTYRKACGEDVAAIHHRGMSPRKVDNVDLIVGTVSGVLAGLPAIVPAIAVVLLGGLVARALGVRDLATIVVISTPLSFGALTLTAEVLGWVGLGGLALTAVVLVVASLVGLVAPRVHLGLLDRFRGRAAPSSVAALPLSVWAAAAFGGLCGLAAWLPGIGDVGLPPQGNDDIWHGYLATRLSEMPAITADRVAPVTTGSADPVTVYPYGLHLAIGIGHTVTGMSIPMTMNGMWAVYAGLLLPIGCATLCWRLFPSNVVAAAAAGVTSVLFNAFPYALNGVMPYTVTLSLVPGFLVAVATRLLSPASMPTMVIPLAALGIFVSHPSVAVVAAVLSLLLVVELLLRERSRLRALSSLLLPTGLVVIVCLPWIIRSRSLGAAATGAAASQGNGEGYSVWGGTRLVLTQTTPWTPGQPILAALVLLGVVTVLMRRRGWSLVVGYLSFAALFVAVLAGIPFLARLTGPWYGNWHRLIAASIVIAPVLAGVGASGAYDLVRRAMLNSRSPLAARAIAIVAIIVGLGAALGSATYLARGQSTISSAWQAPRLVTDADVRLFHELSELTQDDPTEQVLNNWPDGSTWMYAMAGVRPAIPYQPTMALIPPWTTALTPSTLVESPDACRLLLDNNVAYALAKRRGLGGTGGTLEQALIQTPDLATPVFSNSGGTVFRLQVGALRDCAS